MKDLTEYDLRKPVAATAEWETWGRTDPLFGVASWAGKRRNGPNAWTNGEFYKLGESDWNDFLTRWKRYGVDLDACLEIGCGAGRITKHLAKSFSRIHALDVSESMVAYARNEITDPAVTFHVTSGKELPVSDCSLSAVFSTHVFQHFDSLEVAEQNFSEVSRVLQPGGSMMIHLPIYRWPIASKGFGAIYRGLRRISRARTAVMRYLMLKGVVGPIMGGVYYQMEYLYDTLPRFGFTDIEVLTFVTKSNNRPHSFVLARRS